VGFRQKLFGFAVLSAVNAVAAAAFAVLVATNARAVGYILGGVAIAAISVRAIRTSDSTARSARPTNPLADTLAGRALLAAGVMADYDRHGDPGLAIPVTAALIGMVLLTEPVQDFIVRRPRIRAANLPGYRPPRPALLPLDTISWAVTGLVVIAAVFAIPGWSSWPLAGIAIALGAVFTVVTAEAAYRWLREGGRDRQFRAAIEAYDPRFAIYFTAPENTEYHVLMWLPFLERLGQPFVIIVREPRSWGVLAAATSAPVVCSVSIAMVDESVTDGLKAAFYVNNGAANTHMVRFHHITHIQLLHGDSDKVSSANPVTAMFSRIFVAGQAGIDRYAAAGVDIPTSKFDIVGRPQVEALTVLREPVEATTVLYATTWIGLFTDASYCSLPVAPAIIAELLDRGVRVIFRPHPYVARHSASALQVARLDRMLADDRAKTGRQHLFGAEATDPSLFDCMNAADAMISDVSAVASDWLYTEKPFALVNMLRQDIDAFQRDFPLAKAAYVLDRDAITSGAIGPALDDLLHADPAIETRRKIKTYYLGDFPPDAYADGFLQAARRYLD
jgi:hypothetical protein